MTEMTCPVCLETLKTSKPVPAGSTLRCPKCKGSFQMPGSPPPAATTKATPKAPTAKPAPRVASKAPEAKPAEATPPRRSRGNIPIVVVALALFGLVGVGVLVVGLAAFVFLDLLSPATSVASASTPATIKPTDRPKETTAKSDTKPATKLAATPSGPPVAVPNTPPTGATLDPQAAERIKKATVALYWIMPGEDKETIRTGFFALEPDLILTSARGIRVDFGAVLPPLVDVLLNPGEPGSTLITAQVIGRTAEDGLYLLRVQRRDQALKLPLPLSLQPSPAVQPKQTLFAVGSAPDPKADPLTVAPLVVGAVSTGSDDAPTQIRLQGALKASSSGAPLVDANGTLVGMATLTTKGPIALGGAALPTVIDAALSKSSPNMAERPRGIGAIRSFEGHKGAVFSVALTKDGKLAASAGADKTIKLWSVETGQEVKTLTGHTDEVHGVALSADGKVLLSGGFDKTVRLWDVEAGKQVGQLKAEKVGMIDLMGQVYGVAIAPDARTGVSGDDQSARLWDLINGVQLHAAKDGHTAVAFAPDSKTTMIAGLNGLEVWKAEGKMEPQAIKMASPAWVNGVAFTRDGKRVVSCQVAGENSKVSLWDVAMSKLIRDFEGEASGEFFGVALSPDDRVAVSGDEKGFVRVWDVDKGKEIARGVGHGGPVKSVAVSADGQFILSGSEDGTLRLWPMPK